MTYEVHLTGWHKRTQRRICMRFIVPSTMPLDHSSIQTLIEQNYDLSGLDITEVSAVSLAKPTFVPPTLIRDEIPQEKIR